MALYAFDGTWNKKDTDSDELDENTNVYNFLQFYASKDADAQRQLEEYKTGVGTRFGAPGRIVGGFFDAGGCDRVREMVDSFASNWLRNGPEDRTVDVIGFSRGAALALHFCNQLARGVSLGEETVNRRSASWVSGMWFLPSDCPGFFCARQTTLTSAGNLTYRAQSSIASTPWRSTNGAAPLTSIA
ncbi:MAG: DUF2235 domain-containing protein [Chthoniobacterales bacterium]|nr:DUF2235 domain-containing protein [Chthoniobacterales bacterium]